MANTEAMSQHLLTYLEGRATPLKAFRFSDLPGELRHDIYRRYFGTWDAIIEYDRKAASFLIKGVPIYDLMLANRATYVECSHLISKSFSGRLILRDIKIRRERGFGFVSSLEIMSSLCPRWLLDTTRILVIEHGTAGTLMSVPWSRLRVLQEVQLEGSTWPATHCYPCGLSAVVKSAQENQMIRGAYDTWCVNGYKKWAQVPKPVMDGSVRVLTIKQGNIGGMTLKVTIEHQQDGVEVLDRSINSVIQRPDSEKDQHIIYDRVALPCGLM